MTKRSIQYTYCFNHSSTDIFLLTSETLSSSWAGAVYRFRYSSIHSSKLTLGYTVCFEAAASYNTRAIMLCKVKPRVKKENNSIERVGMPKSAEVQFVPNNRSTSSGFTRTAQWRHSWLQVSDRCILHRGGGAANRPVRSTRIKTCKRSITRSSLFRSLNPSRFWSLRWSGGAFTGEAPTRSVASSWSSSHTYATISLSGFIQAELVISHT